MRQLQSILLAAILCFVGAEVQAASCINPSGTEGKVIYSGTYHQYEYCNGSTWVPFSTLDPGAGGSGCSNPAGKEGQLIYTTTYHMLNFCDGTNWMPVGATLRVGVPASCPNVGNICSDNSIYVGVQPLTGKNLFVHQQEQGYMKFSTENVSTGATDWSNGPANQASIQNNNIIANYPAFKACADLNTANSLGHNDWYLPSMNEEFVVYAAGPLFASGATPLQNSDYWTSVDAGGNSACRMVSGGLGKPGNSCYYKSNSYNVRCVRSQ